MYLYSLPLLKKEILFLGNIFNNTKLVFTLSTFAKKNKYSF